MSISTKRGDDGTTGLLYGGRASKDSARIEAVGAIDEAQAALGVARSQARSDSGAPPELDAELVGLERGLWVLMAEVATEPAKRDKLVAGTTMVSPGMVEDLERRVHELESSSAPPSEFVVPGQTCTSAALDLARAVVRRAERNAVALGLGDDSQVVPYLNRLSDLCWLLARACEKEYLTARAHGAGPLAKE